MFKEVQKNRKLYMLVVDQIKGLIDDERLKCGDKLPSERDLSVELGLSRSTVREAMTALEIMGLVEVRSGLGTFVAECKDKQSEFDDLTENDGISPSEIFEARIILEPQLAKLASQRATTEDLENLRLIVEESEGLENIEIEKFEELDEKFHYIIAKSSYNDVLSKFAQNINNLRGSQLWGSMKFKSLQKEGRISRYKEEHQMIFEALLNRDINLAEMLTRKHLIDIRTDIFEDID
ncbi:MAG: FadR family transcriptional regulator [Tissierellales bacterium]|nr:FadR family transcriptional regulator [Tissierellales bacterium]MBN2827457.1 FadR family transcriptional regulator [Tissierellales bacterium]